MKGEEERTDGRKSEEKVVREGETKETREETRKKRGGQVEDEEEHKQVMKDVTGWTLVSKKHRRRTVQIFVKVDGSKVTPIEVSLMDDKVEDVIRQTKTTRTCT